MRISVHAKMTNTVFGKCAYHGVHLSTVVAGQPCGQSGKQKYWFLATNGNPDFGVISEHNKKFWKELICFLPPHKLTVNSIQCNHLHTKFNPNLPLGSKGAPTSEV
jgi:hypothetical protein